jgi:predicted enzyme related to lactoylglutathione lyase
MPRSYDQAMAARIGNVAIDCGDVLSTANFWSAVLGRPLDDGSSADFATIGGADGERVEPAWYFNKVSDTKRAKNRVHIDLVDPDPSAIDKLVALGATVAGQHRMGSHRWTVMQDPEGNEFCIAERSFTG